MPDRVLLLMPTTTYRADAFLEAARRMGVEVALASDRCRILAEASPHAARGALPLDFGDPDAAARAIVEAHRARPVAAVIPTDDATTVIAAKAAAFLGFRANPVEAVAAARDKRRLREALAAAGLPAPRFRVFPLDADPRTAARQVKYPAVLKPVALSASQGVIRANDEREFEAAFERIARLLRSPEIASRHDPALAWILAEDYVPGLEVALEALLRAGSLRPLALFDKPDPLVGPFFEETIYVTPSRLPASTQTAICDAVARAAHAIGLREGPVHAEARLNEAGVFVIEVAARSIGGLCSRALRFGAGVALEELILADALCRESTVLERERRPAGVMMIPIPRAGLLREVTGIDAARRVPGVEEVTITQQLGTALEPLPEGACYLGFIFARADTPLAVELALRAAHAHLRFDVATPLPALDVRRPRAPGCESS
jgi:biotin carboxylase